MSGLRYLDDAAVAGALSPAGAVEAITTALTGGFDPADDMTRIAADTRNGQFLLMPSEVGEIAGVKVATVAPANPDRGLPRIQGVYLLFDAGTLSVRAGLDGTALTTLRTPAVSVAAVRRALVLVPEPLRIVVFGAGPQALGHVRTIEAVVGRPPQSVSFVVRHPERADAGAHRLGAVIASDSDDVAPALAGAHVVVCATTARTPLFGADAIGPEAIVMAVGSHEPDARELDADLLAASTVVVENVETALAEAGDVVIARGEGVLAVDDLVPMRDAVLHPDLLPAGRPLVFKSTGMAWEDLVVAQAVLEGSHHAG